MNLELDIQREPESIASPSDDEFRVWAEAALGYPLEPELKSQLESQASDDFELSLRIVDSPEIQQLNHQYRSKDKPTNVLSFPAKLPDDVDVPLLGDVVICAPIVAAEAAEQEKNLRAHWAHMLIHGILHLLGYDHINDSDAEEMESLEIQILGSLGFDSPY